MSRTGSLVVAAAAASMAFVACAQLVGITDTPVTRDDSPDASIGALGGASGGSPTDVTMLPVLGGSLSARIFRWARRVSDSRSPRPAAPVTSAGIAELPERKATNS